MTGSEFDEAWLTAVHEAAHCAADLVLGCSVVEVVANGGRGHSRSRGRTSVIACLAGPCAEWRVKNPDDRPTADDFTCQLHLADIHRAVERLGSSDGELLVGCWGEARRLIDTHWPAILHIARALHARGRLTGDEVEVLWREASGAA